MKATTKAQGRSRITNGSLGDMDGRSKWARRFRDVIVALSDDLGGVDALTEMQRSLVRRAATMQVELERAEEGFAKAGLANADALKDYQTTVGQLRRVLETLDLKGKAAAVPPMPPAPAWTGKLVTLSPADVATTANGDGESYALPLDRAGRYDLARRVAHVIREAIDAGHPLPEPLANLAQEIGIARLLELEASDATA
ncbi:hypothetical protein BSQ44_24035 [Aquibium oceanicum]|uniref:Uncharacterized protein n=1 Tax=Aquibium oceanicum TaxID=1670800 RepID=A0A1L3SXD1_9HYPH|nr:hypothetical protein [Aquibium oceanicum]APH74093.1 hypothetical protein BSQ44_24035 [Aquibium oceanicum]